MPESKLLPADTTMLLTQASQQSGHGDCSGLPAKRMRLSIENKSLLEVLKEKSNTLQAISWLVYEFNKFQPNILIKFI